MLGDEYIAQHIFFTLKKEQEDKVFRMYVTDALFAISQRKQMTRRYVDILSSLTTSDEEPKETAQDIINRFNEKFLRKEECEDGN